MQKHLYLFFSLDFSVFLLPLLFDLTLYGFLSVNGIWHRRSLIQRLLLQRIRRKLLVDVRHFVMKKNQFLVAIITRETASYLLHVVMSFSHAYGVTMKLLIIVWTENLSPKWCAWNAWRYNRSVPIAHLSLATISPWLNTIAEFAKCLMTKDRYTTALSAICADWGRDWALDTSIAWPAMLACQRLSLFTHVERSTWRITVQSAMSTFSLPPLLLSNFLVVIWCTLHVFRTTLKRITHAQSVARHLGTWRCSLIC